MEVTNNAEGAYPKRALGRQQGEPAKEHGCRIPKVELKFIGRERRENLGKEKGWKILWYFRLPSVTLHSG